MSSRTCIPQRPADPTPAQTSSTPPSTSRPGSSGAPPSAELLSRKKGKAQRDPNAYREGGCSAQAQLLHGEPEEGRGQIRPRPPPHTPVAQALPSSYGTPLPKTQHPPSPGSGPVHIRLRHRAGPASPQILPGRTTSTKAQAPLTSFLCST